LQPYSMAHDSIPEKAMLTRKLSDPGAKSVVFSQFRDFLDILAKAFTQFKIGFTSIDKKDGIQKFKNDPSVCVHMPSYKGSQYG